MPRSYTPPADRIARWHPTLNTSDEWAIGDYVIGRGSELSALLWCFANAEKWQSREYYFWEIAYHLWEKDRDEPMLVKHKWSFRMIRHACQEKYLAIGGSGSSGKSYTMAAWALVNWLARPHETKVLITSTGLEDARGRIWGDITTLFTPIESMAPGVMTNTPAAIRYIQPNGKPTPKFGIQLVTSDKSQSKDKVGKLIGRKAKYMILIADELTDISPNIQSAATGNLDTNPNFQMIGMSNPASRFDPFGMFSEPKDGWDSVNVEIDMEWRTKVKGLFVRFDSIDSPNITPDSCIEYADGFFPYLATQERINDALDILGVNHEIARKSREFMRFHRAIFFDSDGDETFYTEADLIKAGALAGSPVPDFSNATRAAGCDLSFSSGGDKTVMTIADVGTDQYGQYSMKVIAQEYIYQDATNKLDPPTLQVAQQIIKLCKKYKVDFRNLGIDSSGPGKGTCDMLQLEASTNDFLRVEFGGGASDRKVRNDRNVTAKERYYNRASELFFTAKQYLYGRQIYGIPLLVSKQLCQRGYETKRGLKGLVLQVEPKTKYKLRVGGSPDEADSFLVLVELLRTRFSFLPQDPVPQRAEGQTSSSWRQRERPKMFAHLDPSNLGHHANLLPA